MLEFRLKEIREKLGISRYRLSKISEVNESTIQMYDVVGIGKTYGIIVEMKRNLTWKLIEQTQCAIGLADYVFIAIP